jgi:hypothetical protein
MGIKVAIILELALGVVLDRAAIAIKRKQGIRTYA